MKKLIYVLALGIFPLAFSCYGSNKINGEKELQTKPPFKIIEATYHSWVGGQPDVKGIKVNLVIDNTQIALDTIFFRNMKVKLKKDKSSSKNLYVGTFILEKKKEFRLDIDPKKEYGNEAPDVSVKIPFQLKKNEAVVSYSYKNKRVFYKVENIIESKPPSINN
ncbi:hypothetical protein [Lutibacter flavus]|uniref:Lipoprotein n=1 Tax=Lutibacter flavus TaxID=691689 RepID=A0A238X4Z8_9FLAO|nr:hypothetical protein [Lutibacter flavus]SNR52939.1 hypothetical protein SAMN04488111_1494 [Lutibacter flavus]